MGMPARNVPRATYRLQLHGGFDFDAAAQTVGYLARLGISHLYSSPILQAETGSRHGYDVVDHGRISADLGGEPGFARLVAALREHGMGLVVDVVPNHMSIASERNRWWWDVLAQGPASRYADWFDVDWDRSADDPRGALLLPVLPEPLDRALASGHVRLRRVDGEVLVEAADRRYPLAPGSLDDLLRAAAGADEDELDRAIAAMNAAPGRLRTLLDAQHYRLADRRTAGGRLPYRRFFDVDSLIGLRVERDDVFAATHGLILERVGAGEITGLRIDHPDGLRDPQAYLQRLRAAAPDAWIVVEKISQLREPLPDGWPVAGATGYRFCNLVTQLGIDPAGERQLTATWQSVSGDRRVWSEVAHWSRLDVLRVGLASDVRRLTDRLAAEVEAHGMEHSHPALARVVRELLAAMEVYRTYAQPAAAVDPADRAVIERAIEAATRRRPGDAAVLALVGRVLRLEVPGPRAEDIALRFQQLSPAAMAKGVEDTAFYRYLRLVALNEVGGDPGTFGIDPTEAEDILAAEGIRWPHAMLATSTHDTKRGEDVRARLGLLAEVPDVWAEAVEELSSLAERHRSGPDEPDRSALYMLLQTLVGAWPIDADRATAHLRKACREAKRRTSWTDPDARYEAALERLVRGCLADGAFIERLEALVAPLVQPGRVVSLAQLLAKLTLPGVPDMYQGTELWDDSLVDPDNRRPVDFGVRAALAAGIDGMTVEQVTSRADEGFPKLWVLIRALEVRRRHAELFANGANYRPLRAAGPQQAHAVAFLRGNAVLALITRLPIGLRRAGGWASTTLTLPAGRWRDALTGSSWRGGSQRLARLLEELGVALLERAEAA
jgi:(1->4)-alpha-D-glucan 1-alpha-D-glucosylmutase